MHHQIWVIIGSGNAQQHLVITWTVVDLSSMRFGVIKQRSISMQILNIRIPKMGQKFLLLILQPHLPKVNELSHSHMKHVISWLTAYNHSQGLSCGFKFLLMKWQNTTATAIDLYSEIPFVTHFPSGHNGHNFSEAIFKYIFMNENFAFWFEFHCRLFLSVQKAMSTHWFM